MILLSGTLEKSSLAAQTCLRCELGTFMVQDERLTSVSTGDYEGLFEIDRIQPHCSPSEDGMIQLGMTANLKRFSLTLMEQVKKTATKKSRINPVNQGQLALFAEDETTLPLATEQQELLDSTEEYAMVETPPADNLVAATLALPVEIQQSVMAVEDTESSIEAPASPGAEVESTQSSIPETAALTAADQALFGTHFTLLETIALDATESREVLRQQRDRLKAFGYRFDAEQQTWQRASVNEVILPGQLTG